MKEDLPAILEKLSNSYVEVYVLTHPQCRRTFPGCNGGQRCPKRVIYPKINCTNGQLKDPMVFMIPWEELYGIVGCPNTCQMRREVCGYILYLNCEGKIDSHTLFVKVLSRPVTLIAPAPQVLPHRRPGLRSFLLA